MKPSSPISVPDERLPFLKIFVIFLRLGLTSFGGPVAHLGYFRQEFVVRRRWLDEHAYADLVALCQFLPGPASSQVGIALGLSRGGMAGAIASWLGFTLPSAILLVLFGLGLAAAGGEYGNWLHGLKIAAVAVVAQALWGMGKSLCPDKPRATLAVCAAAVAMSFPTLYGQLGAIVAGALIGRAFLNISATLPHNPVNTAISRSTGMALLLVFFLLLTLLPVAATASGSYSIQLLDSFYRAGSLVFGGGHVVLPLLQAQVVPAGWVGNDAFLAGYGAAQAVPGPLFTFAAYLGAVSSQSPSGWMGAGIALVGIFLPSFLLIAGVLPFWERLRRYEAMQRAMLGINAAVVGLLLAAFYDPVWTSAIRSAADFSLAAIAFLLLVFWKSPPWLVVALVAIIAGLVIS
ncbi:MAG: chromate transporter [Gallionellales bacterium RIFCSPLOWO2_12_FULL_59_22]|nr:MAG: chromate transporter [Gallionellales bacterium RIFCSPLOWO2_12_FULL_59_22]